MLLNVHKTFFWVHPPLDFGEIVWNYTNAGSDHGISGIDIRFKVCFWWLSFVFSEIICKTTHVSGLDTHGVFHDESNIIFNDMPLHFSETHP